MNRKLQAAFSDRYIIGVRCAGVIRKLFQIIPAKNGSIYVSFPYSPFEHGRVGIFTAKAGSEDGVIIGDDFPVTAEKVKYSHHPDGAVHFSQSGRVRTQIRKLGVPFGRISGHIFSVTFQGIDRYKPIEKETGKKRDRVFVVFSTPVKSVGAYKFIAHVHSERELAGRVAGQGSALWIRCVVPSGKILWGVTLATKFGSHDGRKYILLLFETIEKVCAEYDEFLMFLGGFDPPEISMDPAKDSRALMFLYPQRDCTDELLRRVGTIDLRK